MSVYKFERPRRRTLLDLDFRDLPTQNLKASGDGDYTIAGREWVTVNTAVSSVVDLLNETGLRGHADATSTSMGRPDSATATHLYLKNTLEQEFNIDKIGALIIMMQIAHNADAGTEEVGVSMLETFKNTLALSASVGFTSAHAIRQFSDTVGAAVSTATLRNALGVQYWPGGMNAYYADTVGGQFPKPWTGWTNSTRNASANLVPVSGGTELGSGTRLHLFWATGNTDGNYEVAFERLRVILLEGTP